MPEFKEKPKTRKSGSRQRSQPVLSSKQAAKLLKDKYLQQIAQHHPETDSIEAQASGQAEGAGSWAVDELAARIPHSLRQRKYSIKDKSQTMRKPTEKAAPQTASPLTGIKEGPTTVGRQPTVPTIKERSVISDPALIHPRQEAAELFPGQMPGYVGTASGLPHSPSSKPLNPVSLLKEHIPAEKEDTTAKPDNSLRRKQVIKQRKQQAQRKSLSATGKGGNGFVGNPPSPSTGEKAPRGRAGVGNSTPKIGSAFYQKGASRPKAFNVSPKGKAAISRPGRTIGQTARHQMTQQAVQQAKNTAKTTATISKKAVVAVTKAASAIVSSIAALAGGGVLLMAMVVVILIAAVASSPFGLFFAEERSAPDTVSVAEAVSSVNMAYNAKLEELQAGDYDSVEINGQAADWAEVLAVFAVKTAGADGGVDVATLDADRVDRLIAVFWDMTTITSETETISHDDSDPDDDVDDSWTEYILHITISARTADDMRTFYHFTAYQNSALDELLTDRAALVSLAGSLSITNANARAVLDALPDDLSPERRAVVETALMLYGKVTYFWGGKSLVIGWDSRWGQIKKVTADGSSTTGTYRPYGLDCSGYVDWVFFNATGGDYIIGHGGGAHAQHTYCTGITWAEAQPGDLVFYPEDSHVGIVCGRDSSCNLLVIHCASGANNVVITGTSGFTSVARPHFYSE